LKKLTKSKKLTFSGHESFQCRHLWLKKGYDFVKKGLRFSDEESVVHLGVGKNMVNSIRFWMKAFNMLTFDDKLTLLAHKLFANKGWDPYLEDEVSLWLLHYQLVKSNYASIYSIIFNELRREKIEFTKINFITFLKRKAEIEKTFNFNEKTLLDDFSVMTKMYLRSNKQSKDKEDSFSGLLSELDLIKSLDNAEEDLYIIENTERPQIPDEIILFVILESEDFNLSVSLNSIERNYNNVGSIFALNRSGILDKVESLTSKFSYLNFKNQAGIKELQFKKKLSAYAVLDKYYAN